MNILDWFQGLLITSAIAATPIAIANKPAAVNPIPAATIPTAQVQSKLFKINVTISSLKDISVTEGASVKEGEIIADRREQRAVLEVQKRRIKERLENIKLAKVIEPPPLAKQAEMATLPGENYAEEEAAIASSQMRLRQAQETFKQHAANLVQQPTAQFTQVERARIELEKLEKDARLQEQMLTQVKQMPDILPEMVEHNEQKLTQLISLAEQARTEHKLKTTELSSAVKDRKQQLTNLQIEIDKSQADLDLQRSKLVAARSDRKYQEYQDNLNRSRRADERSQTEQIYARQLAEYQQQKQIKEAQIAQAEQQVADVDIELSKLSAIRSPVTGKVRRIKWAGQTNNDLSAVITIVNESDQTSFINQP